MVQALVLPPGASLFMNTTVPLLLQSAPVFFYCPQPRYANQMLMISVMPSSRSTGLSRAWRRRPSTFVGLFPRSNNLKDPRSPPIRVVEHATEHLAEMLSLQFQRDRRVHPL